MARKSLLISPELCIGCRGCQTACKSWNQLPGDKTEMKGTFETPPDLTPNLYNKIRYVEVPSETQSVRWLFVSQRCMHCDEAGCINICPAPGALFKTKEGIVSFNKEKCIGCKLCVAACPFDVPRYDEKEKISTCNLCADRVAEGLAPACAKTCPKFADQTAQAVERLQLSEIDLYRRGIVSRADHVNWQRGFLSLGQGLQVYVAAIRAAQSEQRAAAMLSLVRTLTEVLMPLTARIPDVTARAVIQTAIEAVRAILTDWNRVRIAAKWSGWQHTALV